jgi:hypothetical protein
MKFYIFCWGDPSVGDYGFNAEVILPNVIGADDCEWVEWCKKSLNELYGEYDKIYIYTQEELDAENMEQE